MTGSWWIECVWTSRHQTQDFLPRRVAFESLWNPKDLNDQCCPVFHTGKAQYRLLTLHRHWYTCLLINQHVAAVVGEHLLGCFFRVAVCRMIRVSLSHSSFENCHWFVTKLCCCAPNCLSLCCWLKRTHARRWQSCAPGRSLSVFYRTSNSSSWFKEIILKIWRNP